MLCTETKNLGKDLCETVPASCLNPSQHGLVRGQILTCGARTVCGKPLEVGQHSSNLTASGSAQFSLLVVIIIMDVARMTRTHCYRNSSQKVTI
ncbi:hypothetical protein BaRGS_00013878 [Batillaria attramentaria]|uniref:Uncharacterized protein n=1 Tax=Batillaria attramentaria TaxID=370345 RepID=A0ABD0L685_9CAEN